MKYSLLLLLFLVFSCGIPEYSFIKEPEVGQSGNTFTITLSSNDSVENFTFKIYSRYYNTESKEFDDQDYYDSELGLRYESYLTNLGYTEVNLIDLTTIITSKGGDELLLEKDFSDQSVKLTVNEQSYYLENTTKVDSGKVTHKIGDFTSSDGKKILNYFSENDDNIYDLKIEFAILVEGFNIDEGQSMKSIPLYIGKFEIQTLQ